MIGISSSGSFKNVESFLSRTSRHDQYSRLDHFGQQGVDALAQATPVDEGLTASSWTYRITKTKNRFSIIWENTNVVSGIPVAILIQYGHATGTGGWVEGRDFINPVIKPLFDKIASDVWKEVTRNG